MSKLTKFETISLNDLSAIVVSYKIGVINDYEKILIVTFVGEYKSGSEGDTDAAFMCGAAAAGVSGFSPHAVIFDFLELKYTWGDRLDAVYSQAPTRIDPDKPCYAVVPGPDCAEAIRTLELGEFSKAPISSIPWVHDSIEAATTYLSDVVL
jgi:hypothetical protein